MNLPSTSAQQSAATTSSTTAGISIVVVPRERFSCTQISLESIYAHTPQAFELIYVDGGSPVYIQNYLEKAAVERGFQLIRTDHFLGPNTARNIGLKHAHGKHVVFIDNDALVTLGWLAALIRCAEETGAGVVTPLCFVGELEQQIIHMAGGELALEGEGTQRQLRETHRFWNVPFTQVEDKLVREPCGYAEFHCMLVCKQVADKIGGFDEEMLAVSEHIDFSLRVHQAGYEIWFEPAARVTYLATRQFILSDLPYFKLRWSEEWTRRSIDQLIANWNLSPQCAAVIGALNFAASHRVHLRLPGDLPQRPIDTVAPNAQTNVQLYEQCIALGYSTENLALLRRGYEHARLWFGHMYRGCGRPFIAHLIGVASILAAHGAPLQLVIAGLLHSAYTHGNIGGQGTGITPEKRQLVANAIHPNIEIWLYLYAIFDWNAADVAGLERDIDRMSLSAAKTTLIRLANDLEENKSHSICYNNYPDLLARWSPLYKTLARRFDMPELGLELEKISGSKHDVVIPDVLRGISTGSFTLPH